MSGQILIAVVDDDDSARKAIISLVKAFGFVTTGFSSAGAFLEASTRAATDCLISDVHMPGMSGLELSMYLTSAGTPIPTILVTGFASEAGREQARKAGIRCYLAKPIHAEALLGCIQRALGIHAPSTQT